MDLAIKQKLERIEELLSIQKNVLNLEELSNLIGLSKSTIYKLTSAGRIPHFKKAKHLWFDRTEVEDWLRSERVVTRDQIDQEATDYVTLNRRGHDRV